jgi:plastocyanin
MTSPLRPRRSRLLLVAASSSLLLSTACASSSSGEATTKAEAGGDGVQVGTALLTFDPKEARVAKGETVTWVGGDNITHVLVQGDYEVGSDGLRTEETDDKAFNLRLTKKDQKVSHTYDKPGTYTYFCTIHKGMNGTVVVS